MATALNLNVLPVTFDDAEIEVGVYEYRDRSQLAQLRADHSDTHVFRRFSGTELVAVPYVDDAPRLGELSTVKLSDNLALAAVLVRNALMQLILKLPRKVIRFDPLCFLADTEADNFLKKAVSSDTECPDWIGICPSFELSVRKFEFTPKKPCIGVAVGVRTKKLLEKNCRDLAAEGLPLEGRYVGKKVPYADSRIEPKLSLVGRVVSIEDSVLKLADCHDSDQTQIGIDDAYLERNWENFDNCVELAFGEQTPSVQRQLEQLFAEFRTGPSRLKKLDAIASYLGKQKLELAPGVAFELGPLMGSQSSPLPTVRTAPKAVHVFDPAGGEVDTWHDRGLNKFGPYTSQTFTPTHPRICVICQSRRKGRVEQFVHKFLRGVSLPNSNKRAPFENGFIRKYTLDDASVEFFESAGTSPADYQRAVRGALAAQDSGPQRWDLALIQIDDDFHYLTGDENPYLVSKVEFLTHQIPVQEFTIETAELPDYRLGYALNNMALATYSKVGGVPWLLKANPTIAHELVVGLGSARSGEGRLGASERVVGITTVFTGEGNYCLSTVSQAVPYDDYQATLLESLEKTIRNLAQSMNWQPKEHVRLVFHAFKPFKDTEADAVKAVVESLGDYDIEYAFLHVVEDHPFVLFDQSNKKGAYDFETKTTKGVLAPDRGQFIRLSGYEVLLTLTGARDVKRASDGIPRPVVLRLGRQSSFHDMTYLTRQVYAFASHSWRSFFPSPLPVTILYSELIAKMLSNLGTVSQWNSTVMLGRIGGTRWFL